MSEEKETKLDKEGLKKDLLALALASVSLLMILKIVFYKENNLTVLRTALAFLWTSTLPGFVIMEYWHEHLEALERIVIGTVVGFALTGIPAYYLGLIGMNINSMTFVLPLAVMIVGGAVVMWTKKPFSKHHEHKQAQE